VTDATTTSSRVVKAADARPEPLYPAARLLRGATIEAEATLVAAKQTLADAERKRREQEFRDEVTNAAFKIARHVLEVEFHHKQDHVRQLVEGAIEEVRTRAPSRVCVNLHPDDHEIVVAHRDELQQLLSRDVQFDLVRNVDLAPRSILIETEMGHYDFGIDSQLESLRDAVDSRETP
jgi:flagellar biosynthesis/type III secretory pathway protein FliH